MYASQDLDDIQTTILLGLFSDYSLKPTLWTGAATTRPRRIPFFKARTHASCSTLFRFLPTSAGSLDTKGVKVDTKGVEVRPGRRRAAELHRLCEAIDPAGPRGAQGRLAAQAAAAIVARLARPPRHAKGGGRAHGHGEPAAAAAGVRRLLHRRRQRRAAGHDGQMRRRPGG
eukprot:1194615-Prorocentrum_minimum.AAC.3